MRNLGLSPVHAVLSESLTACEEERNGLLSEGNDFGLKRWGKLLKQRGKE